MATRREMSRALKGYDANFWQRIAKAEIKLQKELEAEFQRHEEAMLKLIMKFNLVRP